MLCESTEAVLFSAFFLFISLYLKGLASVDSQVSVYKFGSCYYLYVVRLWVLSGISFHCLFWAIY